MIFKKIKNCRVIITCECGNEFILWNRTLKNYIKIYGNELTDEIICPICRNKFIENNIPNKEEIYKQIIILKNLKRRVDEYTLKNFYPYIYNAYINFTQHIDLDWRIKIYMFRNNMTEFPKCCCGNDIKILTKKSFNKYCSKKCGNETELKKQIFKNTSNNYHKFKKNNLCNKIKEEYNLSYDIDIVKNNNILLKNYCHHENVIINKNIFKFIYKKYDKNIIIHNTYYLCNKCLQEKIIKNDFQFNYDYQLYVLNSINKIACMQNSLMKKYPELYLALNKFSSHIKNSSWQEKKFMFINNLNERPKCIQPKCNNDVTFKNSNMRYNYNCKKHAYSFTISKGESEVYEFIKTFYNEDDIIQSDRSIKKEIDIFIPKLNIGFEFNGIYWHSLNNKKNKNVFLINKEINFEKNYHYNKWEKAKEKNINLITIWEDDWFKKRNIVLSDIKRIFNIYDNININECAIKEVDFFTAKNFIENNSLNPVKFSFINLGLYYKNELMSIITFSKSRNKKILNNEYEILNHCQKLNNNIEGGEKYILDYFIKKLNPQKIILNKSCDNINYKLYKILGFKEICHNGLTFYWSNKKIRFCSSNFEKHKLIKEGYDSLKTVNEIMRERGFYKVYGTGNLKFEWKRQNS